MQRPCPRVRELALPPVVGEGGLDHLSPEALPVAHVPHVVTELGANTDYGNPRFVLRSLRRTSFVIVALLTLGRSAEDAMMVILFDIFFL